MLVTSWSWFDGGVCEDKAKDSHCKGGREVSAPESSSRPQRKSFPAQMLRIAAYARPYTRRITVGVVLVLLGTMFSLVYPIGIAAVVDTAVGSGDERLLHVFSICVLGLFVLGAVVGFSGNYLLDSTGEYLVLDLRKKLLSNLLKLDLAFFHSQRAGDLTARLTSDTASIRHAVTDTGVSLLNQGLMLVGSAGVMVYLNWKLALIVTLLAPVTTVLSRRFGTFFQEISRQAQLRNAESNAIAHEAISGIPLVKSMSRRDFEVAKYEAALKALQKERTLLVRTDAWFRGLVAVSTSLAVVAIFWFGGMQVLAEQISAGELVAFLFYVQNISGCFASFAQLYADLNQAAGASSRVFDLLDIEPKISDEARPDVASTCSGIVEFDDVGFGYTSNGIKVIDGLRMTVGGGSVVALVGNSGCGKSSLLHLLLRLYDVNAGQIRIDGVDIREYPLAWLRERVTLVSQDVFLFSGSVRENIRYGNLEANDKEVERAARFAQAHDFVAKLDEGYDTEVGDRGVKLSGGQRQRIALARAFLRKPKILLLDEATSGVDYAIENKILASVIEWGKREGITTIIVTHRLNSIRISDRVAVLDGGRLIEEGSYDELVSRGGKLAALLEAGILRDFDEGVEGKVAETKFLAPSTKVRSVKLSSSVI
ncbi:ABC transporter ATP-binding protein [Marilutibacter alkalisoli]|uniref:ABC transporter ATP-binding protein n=1 Tax=Marilutibacter alkalisoli TaxID=2591633 RepID=A0A514BNR9_9GAMM|nr:ABC transporter ATP-binding protein [Lysobacter alkalisoli]QDH69023.1 ABC transporter ATP-binding protein [Lysobacter alkalisoli]